MCCQRLIACLWACPPKLQQVVRLRAQVFSHPSSLYISLRTRQVANDRFGRMNTTARVLMRPALSTDILDERPNTWPAPPGGFSSTRVLGPDSDLARGKQKKKKREHNQNQNQKDGAGSGHVKKAVVYTFDPAASGEDHPLLSQGLSAGRGGFSVEELEKERAQKRAKTADAKAD